MRVSQSRSAGAPVTILGTDVDRAALATAQLGVYLESALAEPTANLVEAYFGRQQGRHGRQYELLPGLRQVVQLRQHDLLVADAAPDGLVFDLVLCHNVLIYFERPAQERVLRLLSDSLRLGGYLCLGEAEQLTKEGQPDFEVVDRHARLYRRADLALKGGRKHVAR